MSERATPESDLLLRTTLNPMDWIELSRKLERQRDEAREKVAQLESMRENWRLSSVCRELQRERDEAREDAKHWSDMHILAVKDFNQARELARELRDALEAVNCIDLSPCNGGSCMVATDADDLLDAIKNRDAPLLTKAKEVMP